MGNIRDGTNASDGESLQRILLTKYNKDNGYVNVLIGGILKYYK